MGWAWMFAESIFLERNWEKDRETIGRQIKELVDHPDPIWVTYYYCTLPLYNATCINFSGMDM
jgi:Na+-transporting NADH:ubiquinone oxidoreductase subunit NqrF